MNRMTFRDLWAKYW